MLVAERLGERTRDGSTTSRWTRCAADRLRAGSRADPRHVAIRFDDRDGHVPRRAARRRGAVHVPAGDPGDGRRRREGSARAEGDAARPPASFDADRRRHRRLGGRSGTSRSSIFLRFLGGHRLDVFAAYRLARWPRVTVVVAAGGTDASGSSGCAAASSPGFFVTVPLVISVAAFVWIFRLVDGFVWSPRCMLERWLGREIPGLGILTTALVVLLVGALATNVIGKRLLQRAESYLLRVPVFRTIYAPVKQLVVAFSPDNEYGFKRVVLVEEPRARIRPRFPDERVHGRPRRRAGGDDRGLRPDQPPVSRRRGHLSARHARRIRTSPWSRGFASS